MASPICSAVDSICRFGQSVAAGYYCEQNKCLPCPIGSYGPDGSQCISCPNATWSIATASTFCNTAFSYSVPGSYSFFIPEGVTKIHVSLWGGGGGGDSAGDNIGEEFRTAPGGGGGFASCNITVVPKSTLYYLVAGGGKGLDIRGRGGETCKFS